MKKFFHKPAGFWISLAGIVVLTALFTLWLIGEERSLHGALAALASAGLFAAVCLRFVPVWMKFWSKGGKEEEALPLLGPTPRHMDGKIFCSLLGVAALVLLLVFALRKILGYEGSFFAQLSFWRCADSTHYLNIAKDWYLSAGPYGRLVELVFLPGYPLAVKLVNTLVGYELYSGLMVSCLSFAGAGCLFYRLLRLDLPHKDALRALKYLCLIPGVFFFVAPMSEGLFLLLCAGCLYLARSGRWVWGCALGALAAFTRTLGLTLLVPLVFELVRMIQTDPNARENRRSYAKRAAALLLIPAGFGAYLLVNVLVAGNPFQFMIYQKDNWGQQFGLFFNTASYQLEQAALTFAKKPHSFWGLWVPNLVSTFGSLIVMTFAVKKLRPSYSAWFIAYFFAAMGATWLLSAPRYLAALLPLPLALALLADKKGKDMAATICCALLGAAYLCLFVLRWQVW